MPSTIYLPTAQAIVIKDEENQPQKLVRMADWMPSHHNRDPFRIELDTQWLLAQVCPEHPLARHPETGRGFSHFRSKWKRMPWNTRLWGVAVQFVCPLNQHVWETYIRPTN